MEKGNFTVVNDSKGMPQMFLYTNPNDGHRTPTFYKAIRMTEDELRESGLEYVGMKGKTEVSQETINDDNNA